MNSVYIICLQYLVYMYVQDNRCTGHGIRAYANDGIRIPVYFQVLHYPANSMPVASLRWRFNPTGEEGRTEPYTYYCCLLDERPGSTINTLNTKHIRFAILEYCCCQLSRMGKRRCCPFSRFTRLPRTKPGAVYTRHFICKPRAYRSSTYWPID